MTSHPRWSSRRRVFAALAILSLVTRLRQSIHCGSDLQESLSRYSRYAHNTTINHGSIANTITVPDSPFSFAACLTVKDDNLLLPEWLAYHYEVAPLRRLIVLMDSNSITSPQQIFDLYQKHTDLNISVWTDRDVLQKATRRARKKYNFSPNATDAEKHRLFIDIKQPLFYKLCSRKLQEEQLQNNATTSWTIFLDTDEYIAFNNYDDKRSNDTYSKYDDSAKETVEQLNLTYRHPEAIASFLHRNQHGLNKQLDYSYCMYLPRVQHAAIEVLPSTNQSLALPLTFHEQDDFYTFRYPIHANADDSKLLGKSIVDVQHTNPNVIGNPHRINLNECYGAEHGRRFADASKAFFRVHQHIGSVEDFLARPGDPSRSMETFWKRNATGALGWSYFVDSDRHQTQSMKWWLASFVNQFGVEMAMALTSDLRDWATKGNEAAKSKVM